MQSSQSMPKNSANKKFPKLLDTQDKVKKSGYISSSKSKQLSSRALDARIKKKYELWDSEKTIRSQHIPESKFTNFLRKPDELDRFIYDYYNDLNQLGNCVDVQEMCEADSSHRVNRIFGSYLGGINYSYQEITKLKIRTKTNTTTPLRIFVILRDDTYKVFLIDPLHLTIPSNIQIIDKTYQTHKGCSICMSRVLNGIKQY